MKKRILSLVLALSLCASLLVVPISAADRVDDYHGPFGSPSFFDGSLSDGGSWVSWSSKFDVSVYQNLSNALNYFARPLEKFTGIPLSFDLASEYGDAYWNYKVDAYGVGSCSLVWLTWWADILNYRFNDPESYYQLVQGEPMVAGSLPPHQKLGLNRFNISVRDDTVRGVKRLYDYANNLWIVDSSGRYPYYSADDSSSTATTGFQWLRMADVSAALSSGSNTLSMTSRSALSTICDNLSSELGESVRLYTWDDHFQCAYRRNGALILCDNDGNPLMCPVDEAAFQGAQGGRGDDSKVVDGDGQELTPVEGNQSQVNYTTYQIVLPNGNTQSIDGCYFDNDGDAYVVQTQQNGLVNTGDTIVNSYNTYEYTYNISHTTITYIGSSAEFTPAEYDVYYTLPDGRSSADLTKEDLEQLNLTMDVVPYIRSSDDTRLRSLYHFDGNTEDASYWNYATSFDWTTGASLTYLESNAFNGCLYLDELAHDFTVTLPSSLGSGDFTVDFRYYQSATLAPQDDSYISIGGQEVLRLNGSHFVFNGTGYATPVGNWNHLAFVRKDGTLYFYLNGVRQGSKAFSDALSSGVRFSFGSSQQTYKYLDELRVTNFAVWESAFTPPTVPYDTNLALVLPTDTVPIADEFWNISMTGTNLLSDGGADWFVSSHGVPNVLDHPVDSRSDSYQMLDLFTGSSLGNVYAKRTNGSVSASIFQASLYGSFSLSDTGTVISVRSNSYNDIVSFGGLRGFTSYACGFTLPLISFYTFDSVSSSFTTDASYFLSNSDTPFSYSCVFSDGDIFTYNFNSLNSYFGAVNSTNRDYIYVLDAGSSHGYHFYLLTAYHRGGSSTSRQFKASLCVVPIENDVQQEFVYMALEEGTESTVSAELVSGVAGIPADDLNTPTLAVRSDIPINKKQIGGVRPSFAERGDVYAMVESGFITSLQQYTGYAWQAVDGRIWTGSRWIPYSSYNVITLSDMYDIADASGQSGYEYIYSQQGFWAWLQKWLMQFKTDLFEKLNGLGSGTSPGSCAHTYTSEVISVPSCTDPGETLYTCSKCGDQYTEYQDALDHDYHLTEEVQNTYSLPSGILCPSCGSKAFSYLLDEDECEYSCSCSDCDHEWTVRAEIEYGHSTYTCSRCGDEYIESSKVKRNLFDAIGDLLSDTFTWVTDKFSQLIDAFSGLMDAFNDRIDGIIESVGNYPLLFGAFLVGMPEDLMNIIWFGLIAGICVLVWKKFFS